MYDRNAVQVVPVAETCKRQPDTKALANYLRAKLNGRNGGQAQREILASLSDDELVRQYRQHHEDDLRFKVCR